MHLRILLGELVDVWLAREGWIIRSSTGVWSTIYSIVLLGDKHGGPAFTSERSGASTTENGLRASQ